MNRLATYALAALLAVACVGWAWTSHQRTTAERDRTRAEVQRDSLAADAFAARAEAAGWEIAFGDRDPALLQERLEQLDSALAVDAEASRVRIESLTRLLAEARGSVQGGADRLFMPVERPGGENSGTPEAKGDRESVPFSGSNPGTLPDSVRGPLNDGLLEAVWTYRYGPRTLGLDYLVRTPIDLFGSTAGDGRTIVGARSPDPRVRVSVTEYVVAAQEVRTVRSCGVLQRVAAFGIGAGVGFVGGRFVP